jgi:hypothetical protein
MIWASRSEQKILVVEELTGEELLQRLCGRCSRGDYLIGRVQRGHWQTITCGAVSDYLK